MKIGLRSIQDAVVLIVRPTAAALFAAELLAIGGSWAAPRRPLHDWIFWLRMSEFSAILAAGSLLVCLLVAILGQNCGDEPRKKIGWCAMLNVATIVGPPLEQKSNWWGSLERRFPWPEK
jgi:hypothetical protein